MDWERYRILCFMVALLIVAASNVIVTNHPANDMTREDRAVAIRDQTHSYTIHAPITISSDADFVSQGWPGNGTGSDPYVIADLEITSTSLCISISHTRAYFEIRGCLISSVGQSSNDGIQFSNVTNGAINETIIENHIRGVYLSNSLGSVLAHDTVSSGTYGFYLSSSNSTILMDNSAEFNDYGFYLVSSKSCLLTGNTAMTYATGFYLSMSDGTNMTDNDATGNTQFGFRLVGSPLMTLIDNKAISNPGNGFSISDCASCTLIRNDAGSNDKSGFSLSQCSSCILTNNRAGGNQGDAFYISTSGFSTLTNNIADLNSDTGFELSSTGTITLTNNTATSNLFSGFILSSVTSLIMTENRANDNTWNGFSISSCGSCILVNNSASSNTNNGFSILSDSCTLTNNTASGNDMYGIYVGSSSNVLYENHLFQNDVSNAFDEGSFNSWDDGLLLGNCWGDYNGTGWHIIPGIAGSIDHYPTKSPLTPPFIDNPVDFEYEIFTTRHNITWSPFDSNPLCYEVYRNKSLIHSNDWNGSVVSVNVDGLLRGIYNYTIVVFDTLMNINSDTVFIRIIDTPPTIDSPDDIQYDEGTIGHTITWMPVDTNPYRYEIYRDGQIIDSGDWDGSLMICNIDGLPFGIYNYTMVVYDTSENQNSSSVFVTVTDGTRPELNSPFDVTYVIGETGNVITWNPSDLNPATYSIFIDDELIISGDWNSSDESIIFSIDGLTLGLHKIQIIIIDIGGNLAMDTVYVTVLIQQTTTTTTTSTGTTVTTTTTSNLTTQSNTLFGGITVLSIVGGGLSVIVLIVIVLKKRS